MAQNFILGTSFPSLSLHSGAEASENSAVGLNTDSQTGRQTFAVLV